MRRLRTHLVFVGLALLINGLAIAQDQGTDREPFSDPESVCVDSVPAVERAYQVTRPCIGVGYVPYSYPAVGSCPCGDNTCFYPHRYYCCGKQYKNAWFHKWVGSHLGNRSMLDDYPCACLYPTVVPRPYLYELKHSNAELPSALLPAPAASGTSN